jgi:tetratricopeptide (TPR) repeat protein
MSKAILLLISFLWINIIPLQAEPNRINKIQADLDIIASFSAEYPDSAAFLLKDILFQAAQSNNDSLTAKSHYELAKAYYFNAYYELSSNHFQYALKSNYALENSQFRGRCLNNIGVIEDILGNYALAIDYYLKSLDIDRQKGDSLGVAYSQVNIGLLYTSMKQLELAESILFSALRYFEKIRDYNGLGLVYHNLAALYLERGNYPKHREAIVMAAEFYKKAENFYEYTNTLIHMGIAAINEKLYREAMDYLNQAIEIAAERNYSYLLSEARLTKIDCLIKQGKLAKAEQILQNTFRLKL